MSPGASRRTPRKSPHPAAGIQGGITSAPVSVAMAAAWPFVSSYVVSGNGAIPSGLWQVVQFASRIGRTSL
jgi:hypothetical protein